MINKVIRDLDNDSLQIDVFNFVSMQNNYIVNIQYGIDFRILTIPRYLKDKDEIYSLIRNEAESLIERRGEINGKGS